MLLYPNLQSSRFVSASVPSGNVYFIVDLDRLEKQDSDDMGVWKNNGIDTSYVRATLSDSMQSEVCGKM